MVNETSVEVKTGRELEMVDSGSVDVKGALNVDDNVGGTKIRFRND